VDEVTAATCVLLDTFSKLVEGSLTEVIAKALLISAAVFLNAFFVRLLVLGVHVMAQIDADGTKGFVRWLKASFFYLYNPNDLKTVYIRDGAPTFKPVRLVYSRSDRPAHHE
jgi:hypothetical protein